MSPLLAVAAFLAVALTAGCTAAMPGAAHRDNLQSTTDATSPTRSTPPTKTSSPARVVASKRSVPKTTVPPALNEDGSCLRGLGHIPDVNGRYYTDAINTLRAAGYDNIKINKIEGPHVDQGNVLGEDAPSFPVCKDLAVWLDVGAILGSIDHIANS